MGFQKHDFSKRMNPAYSFGQRLPNSKYYKQQKRLSLAMPQGFSLILWIICFRIKFFIIYFQRLKMTAVLDLSIK